MYSQDYHNAVIHTQLSTSSVVMMSPATLSTLLQSKNRSNLLDTRVSHSEDNQRTQILEFVLPEPAVQRQPRLFYSPVKYE